MISIWLQNFRILSISPKNIMSLWINLSRCLTCPGATAIKAEGAVEQWWHMYHAPHHCLCGFMRHCYWRSVGWWILYSSASSYKMISIWLQNFRILSISPKNIMSLWINLSRCLTCPRATRIKAEGAMEQWWHMYHAPYHCRVWIHASLLLEECGMVDLVFLCLLLQNDKHLAPKF
jgi:hypothetical protein